MSDSNNKFILDYVWCADEHTRPGMSREERWRFLRNIPLREFLVCVYLARKAENKDGELSLSELQGCLLEDHIIEESDTTVQIAGYDPADEVASSFYMRLFETWQNHLCGFSEAEKRDLFAVAAVLPFYSYHYYDTWDLSDEWKVFLRLIWNR
ncbi:MAG: hypothetical protein LIO76_10415 [Clostridiales bacterium]|nr:hypothetical protein [Clostridiales bacterium]